MSEVIDLKAIEGDLLLSTIQRKCVLSRILYRIQSETYEIQTNTNPYKPPTIAVKLITFRLTLSLKGLALSIRPSLSTISEMNQT